MNRESAEPLSPTQLILLLHSVPYLGEKSLSVLLRRLSQRRLTPDAFLDLPADTLIRDYEQTARVAETLHDERSALRQKSAELLRAIRPHPLQVWTQESAGYPERLTCFDAEPPPVLYALGKTALLASPSEQHFTFTVALSTGAAPAALQQQEEIAAALVEAGGVPVTGHDRTAYKRLALVAQRRNRSIVYVLDRGLREALGPDFDRPPFSAARIRDAVFETGRDLALSPFRLDDHGLGANNRRRDQILFALSDIVIALDVRGGGMMMQECLRAHNQGRPVYVAPGGRDGNEALRTAGCTPLPMNPDWQAIRAAAQKGSGPSHE